MPVYAKLFQNVIFVCESTIKLGKLISSPFKRGIACSVVVIRLVVFLFSYCIC